MQEDQSYWFDAEQDGWREHLADRGFVVLKQVATAGQVTTATDLLWRDIESAEGISRSEPTSWGRWKRLAGGSGLVASMAQSEGAWYIRGLPAVRQAFAAIWGTAELLVSMDAILVWRPWTPAAAAATTAAAPATTAAAVAAWKPPTTEGLHLDQNPWSKPLLDCVRKDLDAVPWSFQPALPKPSRSGVACGLTRSRDCVALSPAQRG